MTEITYTLPMDWDEWIAEWREWSTRHLSAKPHSTFRWPSRNFMADAVLGTWRINGRDVELSEVTFPDLTQPAYNAQWHRGIGVTYGEPDETGSTTAGPIVWSLEELRTELGI